MIISDYKFAADNGITTTAVEGCIKAFRHRLEGHVESKGKMFLLDDEACSIILEIIKERELRFVSYDLQAEEKKLWDEYHEENKKRTELFLRKSDIQMEIICLERKLRELEIEAKEIEKRLSELEKQRDVDFPEKMKKFQEEAYKKWVYQKDKYPGEETTVQNNGQSEEKEDDG